MSARTVISAVAARFTGSGKQSMETAERHERTCSSTLAVCGYGTTKCVTLVGRNKKKNKGHRGPVRLITRAVRDRWRGGEATPLVACSFLLCMQVCVQ
jgi:hypothetical protein